MMVQEPSEGAEQWTSGRCWMPLHGLQWTMLEWTAEIRADEFSIHSTEEPEIPT